MPPIFIKHGHARRSMKHQLHGQATSSSTQSSEYKAWNSMKCRCYNPNIKDYKNYGGRGVRVCERWRTSFIDFFQDLGPKPTPEHSLDRIDVNGHYEPLNCKWSTRKEQVNNRTIRRIENFSDEQLIKEIFSRKIILSCPTIS
jgi:hypothetical protein